jgi:hypothetical protein
MAVHKYSIGYLLATPPVDQQPGHMTPGQMTDAITDPVLDALLDGVAADPPEQERIFRPRWRADSSRCVLKIGLGDLEAVWMPAIASRCDDVVPRLLAQGDRLGRRPQRWLVMEDLPHRGRSDVVDTARAIMHQAARFQQQATELDLSTYPIDANFVRTNGQSAVDHGCPGPVAELLDRAGSDDGWLHADSPYVKCHGDVHPWNAVAGTPNGPWRLIDPIPRTAHWAWDAAYAQLTSGTPDTPDLISLLAEERAALGADLPDHDRLDRVRVILLGWSSVMWWSLLPLRRNEPWWVDQVRGHITDLVELPRD